MFKSASEKIIVGVVVTIALGAIYAAWDVLKRTGKDFFIPRGAVIAFTIDCPAEGWRHFQEANGRFLVGAGSGVHPKHGTWQQITADGNLTPGKQLTVYQANNSGGEESHILSEREMPIHTHDYNDIWFSASEEWLTGVQVGPVPGGFGSTQKPDDDNVGAYQTRQVSTSGGAVAHNNIPPFYALNYCVKE